MKKSSAALLVYFFIVLAFMLLRCLASFGTLNCFGDSADYIFSLLIQIVILLGGSLFLFTKLTKSNLRKTLDFYQIKKISGRKIGKCVLIGLLVFILNIFISSLFYTIISSLGYNSVKVPTTTYPFTQLITNLIFTALLPGICEEIAHRGMLLNSLKKYGKVKAVIISALLFGLLHLNIEQFFYASIIGLFLGFLTLSTNSIYPAIIIHFMNNTMSIILSYSVTNDLLLGKLFTKFCLLVDNYIVLGIFLCLIIFATAFYLLKNLTISLIFDSIKEKIFESKRRNFLNICKSNNEIIVNENIDTKNKILLYICFCSTILVTIFTFVWGVI